MKEETYIGHSIHNKQSNISFKNKKKVRKPQEEWYRVENTHEAIISEEVFQKVQELIASRRRKRRNGTTQIFAGLIKCADCGWSLAYGENKQNKNPYGYYHCDIDFTVLLTHIGFEEDRHLARQLDPAWGWT